MMTRLVFSHRRENRFFVERNQRARIDDLDRDAFLGEFFRHLHRLRHHRADRNHRDVLAFALHRGLAQRHQVIAGGNILFQAAEAAVFENYHRVVVANRALEQSFHVRWPRRHHQLQSGDAEELRVHSLGVLRGRAAHRAVTPHGMLSAWWPGRPTCSGAWRPGCRPGRRRNRRSSRTRPRKWAAYPPSRRRPPRRRNPPPRSACCARAWGRTCRSVPWSRRMRSRTTSSPITKVSGSRSISSTSAVFIAWMKLICGIVVSSAALRVNVVGYFGRHRAARSRARI